MYSNNKENCRTDKLFFFDLASPEIQKSSVHHINRPLVLSKTKPSLTILALEL